MPSRGQQGGDGTAPLDQRIGGQGSAMQEQVDVSGFCAAGAQQLLDTLHYAERRILVRG